MVQNIIDQKSSPEARADRVRRLRNMANLSRQVMCINSDIKLDTLIGWEVARHGGLTDKGAIKIIDRVMKEGVICTHNWLLYGIGQGPTVVPNFEEILKSPAKTTMYPLDEDQLITEELIFFRNNNPDSVELQVTDNVMSPPFGKGDYVAGIKRYKDQFNSMIGLDCIVQPLNDELLLRRIFTSNEENKYNLICTNLEQQNQRAILSNISIVYAAPVIWHRKKNPA